ncbi:MAG: hypothetical protein ACK5UE_00580 [Chitinophagales bacterium]|jgi:hypothetical protein|nr:hypothetical protein [Sphingobacteriales bacterium]
MKSNPKLFLSLFPGFIVGMFFQHQIAKNQSEPVPTAEKMSLVDKNTVDQSAERYINTGGIGKYQKVYGATFSKDEAMQIINSANQDVYVRIGFDNNMQTLFIGNDAGRYIAPAEGYCPNNCPFNQ